MPEHSPLPFVEGIGCRIRDANNISVALCAGEGSGYRDPVINMNNAAFIVAACNSHQDLVAACRAMLHACEGIEENYEEDTNEYSFAHRAAERGRAALAKATGGDDATA